MKIQNNTKTTYTHNDLKLLPNGAITEVTDKKLIDLWLKIDGVVQYIAPEDVEAKTKELKKENEKFKKEIEKAKQENEKLKEEIEKLKEEVKELQAHKQKAQE